MTLGALLWIVAACGSLAAWVAGVEPDWAFVAIVLLARLPTRWVDR